VGGVEISKLEMSQLGFAWRFLWVDAEEICSLVSHRFLQDLGSCFVERLENETISWRAITHAHVLISLLGLATLK
jgi:hypothetical protein